MYHLPNLTFGMVAFLLLALVIWPGASREDRCLKHVRVGRCEDPQPAQNKWYYDPYQDKCREFVFSGCPQEFLDREPNRFDSSTQCDQACLRRREENACFLPVDSGRCVGGYIEPYFMWYYDANAQECKRFIYTGCRGNKNQFYTVEDCLSKCRHTRLSGWFDG